jgi:hypothetical protein
MKRAPLFILTVALAFAVSRGSLTDGQGNLCIQIQTPTHQVVLGEPFACTMTWESSGASPITIAYTPEFLSPLIKLRLKGPMSKECVAVKEQVEWQADAHVVIRPGEPVVRSFHPADFGAVNVGDYEMWIEYDATAIGGFWDRVGVSRIRVESNRVHFRIVTPQGNDASIFARHATRCNQIILTAQDLIRDFPTSTYAAYAVWHLSGAEGMGRSDPARVIADRSKDWGRTPPEAINLLEGINVPFDVIDGKKVGGEIRGKVAIAWREKWFGIVLKNHPDIWFANELKLRAAIDQLTLKNYQAARADLEAIAKDDKAPMAPKAKEYLGLMNKQGWIKN